MVQIRPIGVEMATKLKISGKEDKIDLVEASDQPTHNDQIRAPLDKKGPYK